MIIDNLATLATGRTTDLFISDLEAHRRELYESVHHSRILVIGGAGSIGSATVRALVDFGPQALHVVDYNENSLAELVRDLRSSTRQVDIPDFRTLPLDFGSFIMRRFLQETQPYDFILNFAALKHVRSEKDIYSLLQMLNTNIVKQARFRTWVTEQGSTRRYFCVSTDKAANPVNFMGASKRVMEHVLFSEELNEASSLHVMSARFANVAFSDGSLLDSFLKRIQKHQPLAVPRQTRRYFITLQEASEICLLAAICGPDRHILIPRLNAAKDLIDLESVAVAILRHFGFEPREYEDALEAINSVEVDCSKGYYPLLLTPLDTSGEKPYEEFVGDGETITDVDMTYLLGIPYLPSLLGTISPFLRKLEVVLASERLVSKAEIADWISTVVPQFRHNETGKNLDERM